MKQAVLGRANDCAQVRPEWGLVDNAAFVGAPRARSRHLDLAGRSFLHDYDHRLEPSLSVLTLIMTAPMGVTHGINMQYHASTVDNRRYGSGNKVLHNASSAATWACSGATAATCVSACRYSHCTTASRCATHRCG